MNIGLTLTSMYQFMIVRAIYSFQRILCSMSITHVIIVIVINRICLKDVTESSLRDLIPNRNLNTAVVKVDNLSLTSEQ